MVIGVVGSRKSGRLSVNIIRKYIPTECSRIISGGAKGVDTIAKLYAKKYNIDFLEILPNYDLFGKTAPLIRNTEIVNRSEKILAFWDYKSSGTAHAIKESIRLGVPVQIISLNNL